MSGLKVKFDDDGAFEDIQQYVGKIQDRLDDDEIKSCLREMAKVVKQAVQSRAPRKSNKKQVHIAEDIKSSIKKTSQGTYFMVVKGGKSGYRWQWVNSGHIATNGTFVAGNHFVDKAEVASSAEVMNIVDRSIERALKDG